MMNREFVGTGYQEPQRFTVHVEQDGMSQSLTHRVHGAYVDYRWDGGGPGSTDLAQALLWVVTGVEPASRTYRLFKSEVVATWPVHVGECWRISEEEIRQWLAGVEQDTARSEDASRTEARLGQMRDRELRLKSFSQTFKRRT